MQGIKKISKWIVLFITSLFIVFFCSNMILGIGFETDATTILHTRCIDKDIMGCAEFIVSFSVESIWHILHSNLIQPHLYFPSSHGKDPCRYILHEVGSWSHERIEEKLPRDYRLRYEICASHYWSNVVYRITGDYACDVYLYYDEHPLYIYQQHICDKDPLLGFP